MTYQKLLQNFKCSRRVILSEAKNLEISMS